MYVSHEVIKQQNRDRLSQAAAHRQAQEMSAHYSAARAGPKQPGLRLRTLTGRPSVRRFGYRRS